MKAKIHPQWVECQVTCACGNTFTTHAATATMQVDICSQCHPFFTGEERFVDKEGRLDKFKKRLSLSQKLQAEQKVKQASRQAKKIAAAAQKEIKHLSFRQVLNQAKRDDSQVANVKNVKKNSEKKTTAKTVAKTKAAAAGDVKK